jgi:hypothetical protein
MLRNKRLFFFTHEHAFVRQFLLQPQNINPCEDSLVCLDAVLIDIVKSILISSNVVED